MNLLHELGKGLKELRRGGENALRGSLATAASFFKGGRNPVKEALGEPTSYYESISCAFEGMDKIYTYGSIQITTYTEKDVDYIYTIVLLDDGIATPEGIYIGSDVLNVISAYGEMELEQNVVIYTQGNTSITLGFRDGVVVSITYTAII